MAAQHENLKDIKDEQFRRLTGVKRHTFNRMLEILQEAFQQKMALGGRRPNLSVADMLLMTLEYIREYRTYFHIATSYGVSESSAYRTSRWVEDTLVKHPDFALPGRKALLKSDMQYEVILIDATETPIERPKKNRSTSIQAKRSDIRLRANL
jgi:hypothetical protein